MKNSLIPDPQGMEDTIYHLSVYDVAATKMRGWWTVRVQVVYPSGERHDYTGKKDRSYFSALAKSLDVAIKEMC